MHYHLLRVITLIVMALVGCSLTLYFLRNHHLIFTIGVVAGYLITLINCAKWLYKGHFESKSFSQYVRRYGQRRIFMRDIVPFVVGSLAGIVISAAILAIKGKTEILVDVEFYIIMPSFILLVGLIKLLKGYIKFCYVKDHQHGGERE